MKRSLMLLTLVLMAIASYAGIVDYYSFSSSFGAYASITGTAIPEVEDDDALSGAITLGFTFPYGTSSYTAVRICSNGWIGLGSAITVNTYTNSLPSTSVVPVVAPLWDDLSMADGSVQYLVTGTAPNRVFTVQYSNAHWSYDATSLFSFQVRLFEAGKVDFVYGPSTGNPLNPTASIGINMSPGGSGWFYSVTPGTPATVSSTVENASIITFPPQGTFYSFIPEIPVPDDLAAISLTGDLTPAVGEETPYTVTIRNRGSNSQSEYQVKLLDDSGLELGSVSGQILIPGAVCECIIPWTPATAGAEILYGKVVLASDTNPSNDQTSGLAITVQPGGLQNITIGAGNEQARIPMDFYWKNSLFECLYYQSELSFHGTIMALEFYNAFLSNLPNGLTVIWLGTTELDNLSAGSIPASQLTQVFNGIVDYPFGQNTIRIDLPVPFDYTTGNLVLMMQRPYENVYYYSTDNFLCQTLGSTRARKAISDSVVLDPNNMPTDAVLSGQFPKAKFYFYQGSPNDDPSTPVSATGLTGNYPNPFNPETTITYAVKNAGLTTISIYNLKGQLIRNLVNEIKAPGSHSVVWNGRDNLGQIVSSGVYYCRMNTDRSSTTRKLLLMK